MANNGIIKSQNNKACEYISGPEGARIPAGSRHADVKRARGVFCMRKTRAINSSRAAESSCSPFTARLEFNRETRTQKSYFTCLSEIKHQNCCY